jgi:hypothetical protein
LGCEVVILKLEIELINWVSCGFIVLEVQIDHIWVFQCLLNRDPFFRIKDEELFKQIDGLRRGKAEDLSEVLSSFLVLGEVLDEFLAFLGDVSHAV